MSSDRKQNIEEDKTDDEKELIHLDEDFSSAKFHEKYPDDKAKVIISQT